MRKNLWRILPQALLLATVSVLLPACDFLPVETPVVATPTPFATTVTETPLPTPTILPQTDITFSVRIPPDSPGDEQIFLNILDEVTGLALNLKAVEMQAVEADLYTTSVRAAAGSMIKYRYVRQKRGSTTAAEHTANGRAVRYRLFRVDGPSAVSDIVSRWNDTPLSRSTGRIIGQVKDSSNGQPLPNILITAGGMQTRSTSDGSFLLEGLPEGVHNLVGYDPAGNFLSFQQGASIAAAATTPTPINLTRAPRVMVTFIVRVPEDTIPGVPVRLIGNITAFGNTFADLSGGISTSASLAPSLLPQPDGRYSATFSLPVGMDIRYKYTLGDGFWNAEHTQAGDFQVRQLITSETTNQVEDFVETWTSGNSAPIWFEVNVPDHTPTTDIISIQFNPYGWTEPIPMWFLGNNRWVYRLYSPLNILGTFGYRYCRNDQCGSADDLLTAGNQSGGRPVSTSLLQQHMKDVVNSWKWFQPVSGPITVPAFEYQPRQKPFIAGVEFQKNYHPSWSPRMPAALVYLKGIQANWVILSPTWTYTRQSPPIWEPVPGQDPLWDDLVTMIEQARNLELNVALHPTPQFPGDRARWWEDAKRDPAWWNLWFERYESFALHHADLADQYSVDTLILGGDWLNPALPEGLLNEKTPSGVPPDAETRWRKVIAEVRDRYDGTLSWALSYSQGMQQAPEFLDAVDQVYLLWSAALTEQADTASDLLQLEAARLLDTEVFPFQQEIGKPIVLGINYTSARGGITGCLKDVTGSCVDIESLSRPNPDIPQIEVDLAEQVNAYNAVLSNISQRDWIDGVIARGFYPPVTLRDKSASIHGKPAADLLRYWYPRIQGLEP